MPLYDFYCQKCESKVEVYLPLNRYDEPQECRDCGNTMRKMLCAPAVHSDIQPYRSQVTGEMITSRSQHNQHLKQHKLVEVGNEMESMMKMGKKTESDVKREKKKRKQLIADVVNAKL